MHAYSDLIYSSTQFSLDALREVSENATNALQTSAATSLVKALQLVQLQKAIQAVGMFAMFEAMLQDGLSVGHGFNEAATILECEGEVSLKEKFEDLQAAVNVLKHGTGRSYNYLVGKAATLPFRVKLPGQAFFSEGDVSEVATLIEVDDAFVLSCAEVIRDVSDVIRTARPNFVG
ncbi:DUF4375 domain-containing protein (plasmid) [Cupriavidus sp. H19C3]|jgi:hypothetical protein|uniref:hypothetical protein n=1 Tax=Cupriavidus sp. H19C3 TaxID=3241603 RepID=UPI003BF8EBBA